MTGLAIPAVSDEDEDEAELVVLDLGVARAFWEGVPAARLLARMRLHRDEHDLVAPASRATGLDLDQSTWDTLQARLLARAPAALEGVKRAIARHQRAASDEGPLGATDAVIAALVHALVSASDPDASPAEGAAEALPPDESVARACGQLDERLGSPGADRRAAPFEACLRLATAATAPAMPLVALRRALDAIAATRPAIVGSAASLYPWGGEDREVPIADRRACLLERADLERALLRPERELSQAIARAEAKLPGVPVTKIAEDAAHALGRRGALLLFLVPSPRSVRDAPVVPPSSWLPSDFGADGAASLVAGALERGATTVPRVRSIVARGGEPALDAIGREMLEVGAHPFASAVFAEMLAQASRERDVVRLVTYFAIAPDPVHAARALSLSTAREVPTVLRAWLESMLPTDGGVAPPPGSNPEMSPAARLASCLAALEPYPDLHAAVRPLLSRLSTSGAKP
jgi:hypothetical protein